jgi:hypothetical protein
MLFVLFTFLIFFNLFFGGGSESARERTRGEYGLMKIMK